jgi:hypothetical protein
MAKQATFHTLPLTVFLTPMPPFEDDNILMANLTGSGYAAYPQHHNPVSDCASWESFWKSSMETPFFDDDNRDTPPTPAQPLQPSPSPEDATTTSPLAPVAQQLPFSLSPQGRRRQAAVPSMHSNERDEEDSNIEYEGGSFGTIYTLGGMTKAKAIQESLVAQRCTETRASQTTNNIKNMFSDEDEDDDDDNDNDEDVSETKKKNTTARAAFFYTAFTLQQPKGESVTINLPTMIATNKYDNVPHPRSSFQAPPPPFKRNLANIPLHQFFQ